MSLANLVGRRTTSATQTYTIAISAGKRDETPSAGRINAAGLESKRA